MKKNYTKLSFILIFLISTQFTSAQTCSAGFTSTLDSIHNSVAFHDTSIISGHMITYAWNFGDGGTSVHQNPTHGYAHPGTYYVCLTVTADTPHCTSTVCDSIVIPSQPAHCNANYTFHSSAHHANTINFIDHSTGSHAIANWNWNFGDGSTSNLENPSHQYPDTGTYYVCLITSDAHGLCTDTFCQNIIVTSNAGNCIAGFNSIVDSLGNVDLTNTSSGTGLHTNYHWTFGNGHSSSMENAFQSYYHTGWYNICLTITDSSCSDTYCDSIFIAPQSSVACVANFQYQQTNHSINFHNSSTGHLITYAWDFGDGHSSHQSNPSHQYADTGNYIVCLIVSNSHCSDTICQNIYVGHVNICQATFTLAIDTTNGNITFTNTSAGSATNYLWTFGDGDSSTLQNPSHLYLTPGHYTVCLFISDSAGCSTHSCHILHIHRHPHHMALSIGLFQDELNTTGIEEISQNFGLKNYPNPFSNSTTVEYTLPEKANVKYELFNSIGERLVYSNLGKLTAGLHQNEINTEKLNPGIYIFRLWVNNHSTTRNLMIIR